MYFEDIRLKTFRNYKDVHMPLHPGVNIFVGDNGQGKTNLLEALYLVSKGHSFRAGKTDTLIQKPADGQSQTALIGSNVRKKDLRNQIEMRLNSSVRTVALNGKRVSSTQLVRHFPSVLFSPESLSAIKDGPDQRRDLIDDFLISHSQMNARLINDFRRCLRSRNRLLKDAKKGVYDRGQALRTLESLDETYLPLAAKFAEARILALTDIQPALSEAMDFISGGHNVDISVDYAISSQSAIAWNAQAIYDSLRSRIRDLRAAELESGVSLVGPQKHDVRFLYAGEDSRYYCSQGQQRALILSFKMAQIMYHYKVYQIHPFLLLDDVLSELDPEKRTNLIDFLRGIKSQIFLTTTDLSFPVNFGDRDLSVYTIEKGRIEHTSKDVRIG